MNILKSTLLIVSYGGLAMSYSTELSWYFSADSLNAREKLRRAAFPDLSLRIEKNHPWGIAVYLTNHMDRSYFCAGCPSWRCYLDFIVWDLAGNRIECKYPYGGAYMLTGPKPYEIPAGTTKVHSALRPFPFLDESLAGDVVVQAVWNDGKYCIKSNKLKYRIGRR